MTAKAITCPGWCRGGCEPDPYDGVVVHVAADVKVGEIVVGVSRLDDEDAEPAAATVDVLIGMAADSLTPEQALELADLLRDRAAAAAGRAVA